MTILTPSLLDTTRFQPGQAAGAIGSDDMRVLIDTLAGIGTSPNSPKNANYTAAANDYGCMLEFTGSGAQVYSIPLNASVAFDVGTLLWACQVGSGTVTFAGVGGVTLRVPTSATTSKLYQIICVRQRAIDDWIVIFPFVSAGGGGGGTSDLILPQSYGTIIDGGSFGDGLAHPASSNGFASLGAVQAVYPFATATSNDVAGLMIQAAINDAHARNLGETVLWPPGKFRNIPNGLTVPEFTSIQIRGSGWSSVLMCQNCGTNPGISILPQNNSFVAGGRKILQNLALWGLDSPYLNIHDTGGAAVTAMYNAGTRAIWHSSCAGLVTEGVAVYNFDLTTDFEGGNWTGAISGTTMTVSSMSGGATITRGMRFKDDFLVSIPDDTYVVDFISGTGGNGTYRINTNLGTITAAAMHGAGHNYIMTWRRCSFLFNNKNICINRECNDSFEKMLWDDCDGSGGNYGAWINFTTGMTPGDGSPGAADAHIVNCAIDYNSVQQITFLGGASVGGGDLFATMQVLGGHIETDQVASGALERITNDGFMAFNGVDFFENGAAPSGWVNGTGGSVTKVIGCNLPGFNFPDTSAACLPFHIGDGYVSGHGNTNRIPFGALLSRSSSGDVSAFESDTPVATFGIINADQTLTLRHQPGKPITVTNTCTITIDNDSVTNMAIGTSMPVSIATGATLTMAVAGGVSALAGYSIPIVGPAARRLSKTAANAWLLV